MEENNLLIENNTRKIPLIPTIFLATVIVFTIVLFWYNKYLESKNNWISESITDIENKLSNLREDKEIQVYELLDIHRSKMNILEKNSNIVTYMDHLSDLSKRYKISFKWFSMTNWDLKTDIEARRLWSIKTDPAYIKVKDFIKLYREDKEALFDLDFINSFEWMDNIKFSVNLKVKKAQKTSESLDNSNSQEEKNLNDNSSKNE